MSRPTSRRGLSFVTLLFIANGVYMGARGISAMGKDAVVRGISPARVYEWYEVVFFGVLSLLVGAAGIWSVLRK